MARMAFLLVPLALAASCATAPPMPDPDPSHPASVQAQESAPPQRTNTLRIEPVPAQLTMPADSDAVSPAPEGHHGQGGHTEQQPSRPKEEQAPPPASSHEGHGRDGGGL